MDVEQVRSQPLRALSREQREFYFENGYLLQERSPHDRRSFHVRASDKGLEIYRALDALFEKHSGRLDIAQLSDEMLGGANQALRRVEQFWSMPQVMAGRLTVAA